MTQGFIGTGDLPTPLDGSREAHLFSLIQVTWVSSLKAFFLPQFFLTQT